MRKRTVVVALLGGWMLVSSCAFGPRVAALEIGMTRAQVEQRLGRPDGVAVMQGQTVLSWTNKMVSGWSNARGDYHVVVDAQDRVTAYGAGEVRAQPGTGVVIVR